MRNGEAILEPLGYSEFDYNQCGNRWETTSTNNMEWDYNSNDYEAIQATVDNVRDESEFSNPDLDNDDHLPYPGPNDPAVLNSHDRPR